VETEKSQYSYVSQMTNGMFKIQCHIQSIFPFQCPNRKVMFKYFFYQFRF